MHVLAEANRIITRIYPDYGKLARFFSVGVVATVVDWSICTGLTGMFGIYYIFARMISYSVGTVVNYSLNKRYTFKNTYKKIQYQFASFAAVAVVGMALNISIMYVLVEYVFTGQPYVLALGSMTINVYQSASMVIATLIVFMFNYIVNKSLTFKIFR
jgi:putative flippase GtrA